MLDNKPELPWDLKLRPKALNSPGMAPTTDIKALQDYWGDPARKRVWLLCGPPGTGKTTTARALAGHVQEEFRKATGEENETVQINEINCSDNTGVEFARRLVDEAQLRTPRPVVCILDECHQLTKAAQNALLKLLEEPPAYRYYFLCTTEPNKLVAAIQKRCKRIQFEPLTKGNAIVWVNRVTKHLSKEPLDTEIISKIWFMSEGAPRNILQQLQHYYLTGNYEQSTDVVGDLDIRELAKVIMRGDRFSAGVSKLLKEKSYDPDAARNALCGYFTAVLLGSDGGTKMRQALGAVRALAPPVTGYGAGARGQFVAMVADAWAEFKATK